MRKQILILLITLLTISGYAGTIKQVLKDASHPHGIVDGRADNFKPGKPTFIFLAGIGEIGNGSTDLQKIVSLSTFKQLMVAADSFDFNVVAVQTHNQYENGAINYAIDYAIREQSADPDRIYGLNNSLGGFGFAREVAKDPNLAKRYAAILQVVMGPGETSLTAKNIFDSKTPVWFFVPKDDNVTPHTNTTNLYNKIKGFGQANVWLTLWAKGGHNTISRVLTAWGNKHPYAWRVATCGANDNFAATDMCNPVYNNVFEWCFANIRGQKIYSPAEKKIPVAAPIPKDTIRIRDTLIIRDTVTAVIRDTAIIRDTVFDVPADNSKIGMLRAVVNAFTVKFHWLGERFPSSAVEVWWKDGSQVIYKSPEGYRCSGVTVDRVPGGYTYTLDIRNEKNEKQPSIIVGPYK